MRPLIFTWLTALACLADESAVFPQGSKWETVSGSHHIVEGIAATADGTVYLTDVPDGELFKLPPGGKESLLDAKTGAANGLAIGPDGRLYGACMHRNAIAVWDLKTGARSEISIPTPANDLALTATGILFHTWGKANAVYRHDPAKTETVKVADVPNPNGITLSGDGRELWVGQFFGDTVLAFPILADGRLGASRPAFKAKVPADGRGLLDGMTPLPDGRLLVATALGLQILSATAEPIVLPNPTTHRANYVRILKDPAGIRWIYAAHEKSVLRRKTLL